MLEDALRRLGGFPEKDPATTRAVMQEINGDGGLRMDRNGKTQVVGDQGNDNSGDAPDTNAPPKQPNNPAPRVGGGARNTAGNQRGRNPVADRPQEPNTSGARKPMRA
jgi:hypothetical protein